MPIVLWIQTEIESSVIQHRLQHRERIFFFQYGECQSLSHVCLCDLMDCSPLGSSVHGILQAGMVEWVAISFSSKSSWHKDQTCVSAPPALHTHSLLLFHRGSPLGWPKSVFRAFHNILRKTLNELVDQSNTAFTNEEAITMKRYMTFWIAVCHLYGTAG